MSCNEKGCKALVVGLDLKGAALSVEHAQHVIELATDLGIQKRLLIYVWGVHPGDHGYEVLLMMRDKYPEARAGILPTPLDLFTFHPMHLFSTGPLYGD